MPRSYFFNMARDYCYQRLLGTNGNPKWPTQFDLIRISYINQIDNLIANLQKHLSISPTTVNLSASPTKFLAVLHYVIDELEKYNDISDKPSWNFSLVPVPSFRWKYIAINCKALATIVKKQPGESYETNIEQFYSTFDFKKVWV